MAAFIDLLLAQLVGADEVTAGAARSKDVEISRYFFDKQTNQSIIVDWRDRTRRQAIPLGTARRAVPFEVGPRNVDSAAFVAKRRLDRGKETITLATATADWLAAN